MKCHFEITTQAQKLIGTKKLRAFETELAKFLFAVKIPYALVSRKRNHLKLELFPSEEGVSP